MLDLPFDEAEGSIGDPNVAAAEAVLAARGVPAVATDTGGHRGRSLRFDPATGRLHVSSADGDTVIRPVRLLPLSRPGTDRHSPQTNNIYIDN